MVRILILANNDVGLYKFRKELIQTLLLNHEVYISLPPGEYVTEMTKMGCYFIDTPISRRGTNPFTDLQLLFRYSKTISKVGPHVVLTYTIKPNVYGGLACRASATPCIANVTGLGTSLEGSGLLTKLVSQLYRSGLRKAACVFFQNAPNRQFFETAGLVTGKSRLIPGSGVNLEQYILSEYPDSNEGLRFLFIGRIMEAKGVSELLQAAERIKASYSNVQFSLVGDVEEERFMPWIQALQSKGTIEYLGYRRDIKELIVSSHATVLPSYHEGTANVLLESAATGRPVLASRVPGCQETFDDEHSGLGFEARNVDSLVDTLTKFIELPHEQKRAMGIAGRRKMELEYDRELVIKAYLDEISTILSERGRVN